ncbi:hypothetical protein JG688_00012226, partial [Phytophthora aleatoria]
ITSPHNSQHNSADSTRVATRTSNDPIALSDGSASSPEPDQDDGADLAHDPDVSCDDSRTSRRKLLHSQVYGSDDEDDDESHPPSPQALGRAVRAVRDVPVPRGKSQCTRATRRSLYDAVDGAESSAPTKKYKRRTRRAPASPKSHRKSKKHKKSKMHKKHLPRPLPLVRIWARHRFPCQHLPPPRICLHRVRPHRARP